MLTDDDIKKLKQVLATKDDLKQMASKDDLNRFASKDDLVSMEKRVNKKLAKIQKDLTVSIKLTDIQRKHHHDRITQLEEKAGVTPPPFPSSAN